MLWLCPGSSFPSSNKSHTNRATTTSSQLAFSWRPSKSPLRMAFSSSLPSRIGTAKSSTAFIEARNNLYSFSATSLSLLMHVSSRADSGIEPRHIFIGFDVSCYLACIYEHQKLDARHNMICCGHNNHHRLSLMWCNRVDDFVELKKFKLLARNQPNQISNDRLCKINLV